MVLESICCINTSEIGSLKDNKLHRVGRDSRRTGAMLSPQWSLSLMLHWLTYCTDCMQRAGLPSRLGTARLINHWKTREIFSTVDLCLGQNVSLLLARTFCEEARAANGGRESFTPALHEFLRIPIWRGELKLYSKRTSWDVDCSPSHVVTHDERWAHYVRKWAPKSVWAGTSQIVRHTDKSVFVFKPGPFYSCIHFHFLCLHSTIFVRPASCIFLTLRHYLHLKSLLACSSRNVFVDLLLSEEQDKVAVLLFVFIYMQFSTEVFFRYFVFNYTREHGLL